jgi:hypothetical protein
MLAHVKEINQCWNDHNAAANAHDPGKSANHKTKEYVKVSHGRNNRRKQLFMKTEMLLNPEI